MGSDTPASREIEQVVADEWSRSGRPLLISRLGMRLSPETKMALSASGHGLKRYMQEHLSDTIRFLPMRGRGGGVAPLAGTEGLTDQQIEERHVDRPEIANPKYEVPQYWGEVWRGFQTPMPDDMVRYVLLEAFSGPVVGMSPKDAQLPANAKLIDSNDLILPDEGGPLPPRAVVHQAIQNWCIRENVPVASLIFPQHQSRKPVKDFSESDSVKSRSTSVLPENGGKSSYLMRGLNLLNREELSRINIPADLVMAILERSASR